MKTFLSWIGGSMVVLWSLGACWLGAEVARARRLSREPSMRCDLCLVPGKFPELHSSVPGRFCSQCAMAVVEVRARIRTERRAR